MAKSKAEPSAGWLRKFRYEDEKTSKYWEVSVVARAVTVSWGKTGSMAQQRVRSFATQEAAEGFAAGKIREKTRKGYLETRHARLEQISRQARTAAKKLRFVGTEGGPLLLLPHELLPAWSAGYSAAGEYVFETTPCDYDRACEWKGQWVRSIKVGSGAGLVLHSDAAAGWLPGHGGGIIVSWAAADSAAPLAHVALTAAKSAWTRSRCHVVVGPSRRLVLFDAALRGADLSKMRGDQHLHPVDGTRHGLLFRLPEGRYAVDRIDNIEGALLDGAGPTEFSAELTRLRLAE